MKKHSITVCLIISTAALLVAAVYGAQINPNYTPLSNPIPSVSPPQNSSSPPPSSSTSEFDRAIPAPPVISIYVPDNYSTIQQAINQAIDDSAIFVRSGTYNETVTITKPIWLIGEDEQTTTIDAHSQASSLLILADNVTVTGFHIINTPIPSQGNPWFSWEYIPAKQLPSIQINKSSGCNIYGNLFTNGSIGVNLANSQGNAVFENLFSFNGEAICISGQSHFVANNRILNHGIGGTGLVIDGSNNIIVNNTIRDGTGGIWFKTGESNTLRGNVMRGNFINLLMGSYEAWLSFDNDVDPSNTVEGKPIYYWVGRTGETVPPDAGAVILINSTRMTVKNLILSQSTYGIMLVNTNNSTVENNQLASQSQAQLDYYHTPGVPLYVLLLNSSGNHLEMNRATLWLNSSSANTLTQNTGVIRLTDSNDNIIADNTITKIGFMAIDWSGINLRYSTHNLISGNHIKGNSAGIWLCDGAKNNRVENNIIDDNAQGGIVLTVWPDSSGPKPESNIISSNTITDNGNEGILDSGSSTQIIGNRLVANGGCGLEMSNDVSTIVTGNVIEGFHFGMYGKSSVDCIITANNITINSRYSQYGVWFQSGMPGTFFHNNFFVPIDFSHSQNATMMWDNGSEGNWWYFYTGEDMNGDGIGDIPYEIGPNNIDRYPLMKPFEITLAIQG